MTSQRGGSGAPDSMRAGAQTWEAGYQSLADGWRQAQEFWMTMARSWGEAAGVWMGQSARAGEAMEVVRELQEAAFAAAQAWMRLPLVLMGGVRPDELQEAAARLSQAQGRAYQLWLEAVAGAGGAVEKAADRDRKR